METSASENSPLVILNPAANRGDMAHYREAVRSRTERERAAYVETTRQGEAKKLAARAAEEGRPVVIVGGDGSIHEVVNGILSTGRRVPLGIVAAGTGNDYAWNTLNLAHDPAEAIERAFAGRLVDADAGIVNGEYFANALSVGLDANIAVAAERLKTLPFMSGPRLYYSATLQQLLFGYHHCPWLTLRLDAGEPPGEQQARRYVVLAVTIGPTYGGAFASIPPPIIAMGCLISARFGIRHCCVLLNYCQSCRKVSIQVCQKPPFPEQSRSLSKPSSPSMYKWMVK